MRAQARQARGRCERCWRTVWAPSRSRSAWRRGAVASEVEYDSFGQRSIVAGKPADLARCGYTGREHDAETGLLYSRALPYDPVTGTFLQQDPIGFAAGDLNLYAYVENDPFNRTDPSGLTASATMGANTGRAARRFTPCAGCADLPPCVPHTTARSHPCRSRIPPQRRPGWRRRPTASSQRRSW